MKTWILFCLIYSASLNAQVRLGSFHFPDHKGTHQGYVMTDSASIYGIQFSRTALTGEQNLFVNVYDINTLEPTHSFDISPKKETTKRIELKQIFALTEKMILVLLENLENNDRRVVVQVISKSGDKSEFIPLDTLPSKQSLQSDFEIVVDKQEQSFLLCTNFPVSADDNQQLKINAYTADLKLKWQKNILFPQRDKQFLFSDWQYDGSNHVYFLARHIVDLFQEELQVSQSKQNKYHLWGYDSGTDQVKEIVLSLNEKFINKINMIYKDNMWIVAGLFSNNEMFRVDGVFNLILDSTFRKTNNWVHTFTLQEQMMFSRANLNTQTTRGIDDILLKGIEILDDNSFVLIGEEFRKEIEQPSDTRLNPTMYNETYYYNDITLFWFNEKGKNVNMFTLPKIQVSLNDRGQYSSFFSSNQKSQLWFYYNDNPKNTNLINPNEQKTRSVSSNGRVVLKQTKVDKNGIINTSIILPPSRSRKVRPQKGAQLLNEHTYFLIEKNRKRSVLEIQN